MMLLKHQSYDVDEDEDVDADKDADVGVDVDADKGADVDADKGADGGWRFYKCWARVPGRRFSR